jgi:hypothetical protein
MPHSQDDDDYPSISDLAQYGEQLITFRWEYDRDGTDTDMILQIGENLLEYCDFLIRNRTIKVCVHYRINISASLPRYIIQWQDY